MENQIKNDARNQSLNDCSCTDNIQQKDTEEKKHKGHGAIFAASMGRAATAQVNPHSNSGLANTGTNISYEGATAPGSGGSVGTGYTSGKAGVDETITTDSDYDMAEMERPVKKQEDEEEPLD